ncbi:DUF2586 domain-containing protein [Victivallis sp. Marseille-Q1083]|uniref:DUF2586 domain-containing protein n=1 Tax=Victivallis sp. Marseille-Q1083 TaxID=2717288 RepID=UPI00158EFCFC|nr:DUF2586 domain-containing protein [Victivallis sp. Marseille-Q1083]
MAIGSVTVTQVNDSQGAFKQCEKTFLYVGTAADGAQAGILTVGAGSDLDSLFGAGASNLKTQLAAAVANAQDTEFFAYAIALEADEDWKTAVLAALEKPHDLNVEAIAVCDPVSSQAEVLAAQSCAESIVSRYAKFVFVNLCCASIGSAESWSAYLAKLKELNTGVAADRVAIVPLLHGNNLGAVCGRLCNPSASIADTPMRTMTGAVTGLGAAPVDGPGAPLDMPTIKALAEARFSVPQWYPGYDGIYWADHPMLDAEGGDFQVVEYRRIIDYLARRVRIRAIRRIGDRRLNSTAASIAQNKTYFAGPLRDAAKSFVMGGIEFPAMIYPPGDDAIAITWTGKTEVAIAITAQPYNCPKKITVYLGLDLSND